MDESKLVDDSGVEIEELSDEASRPPEMLTTHHFVPDDEDA